MAPPRLRIVREEAVMRVLIDNPPMNLLDGALRAELDELSRRLVEDSATRVVILESANRDFFIAHADVRAVRGRSVRAQRRRPTLGPFHEMVERWRTLPQPTIGVVRGAARGGGFEFLLSLDMIYAATGATFGLPEVALGILPAGGGTQRLARNVSRGHALEVILSCEDYSASEMERFGIITRMLPEAELESFVSHLAERIALWPADAVRLAKASVDAAVPHPVDGLLDEYHYFSLLLAEPDTDARLGEFLAAGGQTPEGERELGRRLPGIFGSPRSHLA
jgi:enoyl-CoA hydratase/carnithine racemase